MLITSRQYVKGVRTNHPYSFCVSAGKTCFMEGTPWGALLCWNFWGEDAAFWGYLCRDGTRCGCSFAGDYRCSITFYPS